MSISWHWRDWNSFIRNFPLSKSSSTKINAYRLINKRLTGICLDFCCLRSEHWRTLLHKCHDTRVSPCGNNKTVSAPIYEIYSTLEPPAALSKSQINNWYGRQWDLVTQEEKERLRILAASKNGSLDFIQDEKLRRRTATKYYDQIQEIMEKLSARCGVEGFG